MTDRGRQHRLAQARQKRRAARSAQRRRRRLIASMASVAAVAIAVAVVLAGGLGRGSADPAAEASDSPSASASTDSLCAEPATPRADNLTVTSFDATAAAGVSSLVLETNCGPITIGLDSRAPQTVASMAYLAKAGWFDQVRCHRLTTAGIHVVQCGDPRGNGTGGPGYSVPDENLPTAGQDGVAIYPRGTVAMANSGPGTGGSQFFIVYEDSPLNPAYTVWGQVTSGIDIVDHVADGGVAGGGADGPPLRPLQIQSVTLKP